MAHDAVCTYAKALPNMVVLVVEGRGGANGNNALFDYLKQSGDCVLCQVMDMEWPPGNKGYKQLLILQKKQAMEDGIKDG
jgi:hypothetical protein